MTTPTPPLRRKSSIWNELDRMLDVLDVESPALRADWRGSLFRHLDGVKGALKRKRSSAVSLFTRQERAATSASIADERPVETQREAASATVASNVASSAEPVVTAKDTFEFLALPPELRNRIYWMCLFKGGPIYPCSRSSRFVQREPRALLQANRQIRDEAYGIYYGSNQFRFRADCKKEYIRTISLLLRSMRQRGLAHVQTITLEPLKCKARSETNSPKCGNCAEAWRVQITLLCRTARMLEGSESCWDCHPRCASHVGTAQDAISERCKFLDIERRPAPCGGTYLDSCERAYCRIEGWEV